MRYLKGEMERNERGGEGIRKGERVSRPLDARLDWLITISNNSGNQIWHARSTPPSILQFYPPPLASDYYSSDLLAPPLYLF